MSYAPIIRESLQQLSGKPYCLLLHILLNCNATDDPDFRFDNEPFPLRRGQLITSVRTLCSETGFSRQETRTALKNLEKAKILTNQSTNHLTNRATLITITEPDLYLYKFDDLTNHLTNDLTNPQPTPNQPLTTINKEDKEDKEEESTPPIIPPQNFDSDFEDFWQHYTPIKVTGGKFIPKGSKQKAKASYAKTRRQGTTHVEIMHGLASYLHSCQDNDVLTKQAVVFLNQRVWEDDYGDTSIPSTQHGGLNGSKTQQAIEGAVDGLLSYEEKRSNRRIAGSAKALG